MNILEIKNLSFSYENNLILNDISIHLKKGELVTILGGSGAGKTTLFNIIAGFIKTDKIVINGDEILKIGYMQQNDLLLEHLTVLENISLPLVINNIKDYKNKALELLDEFNLSSLAYKYPKSLSGGQKQRIAFLRTIILRASLYLLDEPFNSLDFFTKQKIYEWFKNIQKRLNLSTLLITHDINEALFLSDRIYLLENGKIIKELISKNTNSNEILKAFQDTKQF